MQDPFIVAFLYSIPLIGIVWYISSRKDLSISPGITWTMFIITFFLSSFAGVINSFILSFNSGLLALSLAAFNEELFKFIMLLIFIPTFKKRLDIKKAFFLGATCCLSFAVIENYSYVVDTEILPGLLALVRVVMPSPMHFLTGGIIAIYSYQYFVIGKKFDYILRGLSIGTIIHIFYNVGATTSLYLSALSVAAGIIIAVKSYQFFEKNEAKDIDTDFAVKLKSKIEIKSPIENGLKIIQKTKKNKEIRIIKKKK